MVAAGPFTPAAGSRVGKWRLLAGPSVSEVFTVAVIVAGCLTLGAGSGPRWLTISTTFGLLAIVVSGNEIIWGLGGLPSLGYNGSMAVGAYTAGFLTTRSGMGPWEAVPFSIVAAVLAAAVLWPFVARLPSLYFTVASLGFGLMIPALATAMVSVTGGSSGLYGIPTITLGSSPLSLDQFNQLAWLIAGVGTLAAVRMKRSRFGLGLLLVRADEQVARACGVSAEQAKFKAFLYGSGAAGFAGALFAYFFRAITPESFTFILAVALFAAQVIGGIGTGYGALVGTIAIGQLELRAVGAGSYTGIVFGTALLVAIRIAPGGIVGLIQRLRRMVLPESLPPRRATNQSSPIGTTPSSSRSSIRVDKVSKNFGGVQANIDISLQIQPGLITGIVGANGAGKTTLLDVISGMTSPDSGDVMLGDKSLVRMPAHERARLGVGRTFQRPHLVPLMTVLDNVAGGAMGLGESGVTGAILGGRGQRDLGRMRDRAYEALDVVGIGSDAGEEAVTLPFGKIRLVEMARALASQPSVLLLDEPMSGLDSDEKAALCDLLRRLAGNGLAIALVEHDTAVVARVCDRVWAMDFGRIIAEAPGSEIFSVDVVRRSYMGGETP